MKRIKKVIPEFNFDVVYDDYLHFYRQKDIKPFRTLQIQILESWIWNGKNDKAIQVVGMTEKGWFVHKENNFEKPKKINRCHYLKSQKEIIEDVLSKLYSKKELYSFLSKYDVCILGTSTENMNKAPEVLYLKFDNGYFRCQTVGYKHQRAETEYLKSLDKEIA